jgi:hypothetical protein
LGFPRKCWAVPVVVFGQNIKVRYFEIEIDHDCPIKWLLNAIFKKTEMMQFSKRLKWLSCLVKISK